MNGKYLSSLALLTLVSVDARRLSQTDSVSERIVNGAPADVNDYPFLVSLRASADGQNLLCAGTVLRPNVVLTAAHCVSPDDETLAPLGSPYNAINNFTLPSVLPAADVVAGDPNAIPTQGLVQTKTVVTSSEWNVELSSFSGFDIALLLLENDLVGVEPISLAASGSSYTDGEPFTIAGWGSVSAGGQYPPDLLDATVNYVPTETCYDDLVATEPVLPQRGFVNDGTFICAQGALVNGLYTDTCQGDSGGPMIRYDINGEPVQVGVVSWGIGCGGPTPGVYTNVAFFHDWIDGQLRAWERLKKVDKIEP